MLKQYRKVAYAIQISESDMNVRMEMEHGTRLSTLEVNAELAGVDLSGSKLEGYARTVIRSKNMLQIIKNALIFSLLGIKRNLMAIIGIFVVAFVNFTLYYLVPSVGILMPFIWTFSFSSFISAYCAYPIIKRYMIDPHYGEDGGEAEEAEETERVFTDRG